MTDSRDFHLVAYAVLRRDGRILLARRAGVSYAAGCWGLPGGHVEKGESLAAAAARETCEEVGVHVDPADLRPIGMCRYDDQGIAGVDVFFVADEFRGEPHPVSECDRVSWHLPVDLPLPVVPWLPDALARLLRDGEWFGELLA